MAGTGKYAEVQCLAFYAMLFYTFLLLFVRLIDKKVAFYIFLCTIIY